jgi:hypothetical protein
VGKSGWNINPASRPAQVYYDPGAVPVTFVNVMPNGTAGLQTTSTLTLTFNQTISGLGAGDITLWPGSTGAARGELSAPNTAGNGVSYTLGLNNVTAEGDVYVTVVKSGYTVNPATISVMAHHLTPLATGGIITYDPPTGIPQWEIHTFTESDTLAFLTPINSVNIDYLIVAGGGSSGEGFSTDYSGGGGAGGLLYKNNEALALANGSVAVIVGDGGTGGANGGLSAIGSIQVPGGGGGAKGYSTAPGGDGGSGGGGAASGGETYGAGGQSNGGPDVKGYPGGSGGELQAGGGGGGAEGAGTAGSPKPGNAGGTGGDPWNAANAASWIVTATGTTEFSRGGNGGDATVATGDGIGVNYGDGGAGRIGGQPSAAGHSGIVVIRFQRPATSTK